MNSGSKLHDVDDERRSKHVKAIITKLNGTHYHQKDIADKWVQQIMEHKEDIGKFKRVLVVGLSAHAGNQTSWAKRLADAFRSQTLKCSHHQRSKTEHGKETLTCSTRNGTRRRTLCP